MQIKVKVTNLMPLQNGTTKSGTPWTKIEFVGETMEQYPKKIAFTVMNPEKNDNVTIPIVGDEANVSFDIESRAVVGRDGNERWYTDIRAYKVDIEATAAQNPQPQQQPQAAPVTPVVPVAPSPQQTQAYYQPQPQYYQQPQPVQTPPQNEDGLPF